MQPANSHHGPEYMPEEGPQNLESASQEGATPPKDHGTSELAKQEARQIGIQNLLRFLKRVLGTEDINDYEMYTEKLSRLDLDQFVDFLTRINGLLNEVPIHERSSVTKNNSVSSESGELAYVPPLQEDRNKLLEEAHDTLCELSLSSTEVDHQKIALLLFNLIIYLHLFKDGNGRTARAAYTLFTPRKKVLGQSDFEEILLTRSNDIQEYHQRLNDEIYLGNLYQRNLEISKSIFDKERSSYKYRLEHSNGYGFDCDELGFISAFDAMTPEECKQYSHYYMNEPFFYFVFDELPRALQNRIEKQHFLTRDKFAEVAIFDIALYPENWLPKRMAPLYKRWGYEPSAT